ncbi:MAG TPA: 4-hydroxythreonine-4-phosphate dehydrogenase PdxA [Candidatus Acidoferrales bacterium]|nr:4-hydroxythreonine-4-phosphate dehydrogenase PdxA [Candidatus Acidoferrales bacterium]
MSVVAITVGDYNGIGPEVALKAAASRTIRANCTPLLIGPFKAFEFYANKFSLRRKILKVDSLVDAIGRSEITIWDTCPGFGDKIKPGKLTKESGAWAGKAIEKGVELCTLHQADAIVTAPVSKEALRLAGYSYPGQTEMVTVLSKSKRSIMVMASGFARIALATIHVPVSEISHTLSEEIIRERLDIFNESIKQDFGIKAPRIAVLGLNPHAGENGLIGKEENEIIIPAIEEARSAKINAVGPFPADAFFGTYREGQYDGILAMYHDQGLIPLKMKSFSTGVNFTAGINIVRTSPDHGTAFDIAGKGIANPSSTIEAIKLALEISKNRKSAKD